MSQPFPLPRQIRASDVLTGDGVTKNFGGFNFKIFDIEDVRVLIRPIGGEWEKATVVVAKTNLEAYSPFTIEFAVAPASTTKFIVLGTRLQERESDVTKGGYIDTVQLEKELSKLGIVAQEIRRDLGSTLRLPPGADPIEGIVEPGTDGQIAWWQRGQLRGDGPSVDEVAHAQEYAKKSKENRDITEDYRDAARTFRDLASDYASIALSDSGNVIYPTVASMPAIEVPNGINTIRVNGYAVVGDGGGGLFRHSPTPPPSNAMRFQSGDGRWWLRIGVEVATPNTRAFILNPLENQVFAGLDQIVMMAAGSASQANKIGIDGSWTVSGQGNSALTAFLGWGPENYALNTAGAGLSSIVGGYDNVSLAFASSILGGLHCQIGPSTEGHNNIVASVDSYIHGNAGRGNIVGARRSAIKAGVQNIIVGGDYNRMTDNASRNNIILGGERNDIDSGRLGAIISGEDCKITGLPAGAGSNNAIILGGIQNEIGAQRSAIIGGVANKIEHQGAIASGHSVRTVSGGAQHLGVDQMVEKGDAQHVRAVGRVRTTGTTNTNMGWFGSNSGSQSPITLPAVSAGTGKIMLVGMRDGTSDGNNDASYAQLSYLTEFGFMYDGTNGFLFKTGTETTVAATDRVLNLELIAQANNAMAAPATPPRLHLFTSSGLLQVRLNGLASTTINWVAHVDFVMTRVS